MAKETHPLYHPPRMLTVTNFTGSYITMGGFDYPPHEYARGETTFDDLIRERPLDWEIFEWYNIPVTNRGSDDFSSDGGEALIEEVDTDVSFPDLEPGTEVVFLTEAQALACHRVGAKLNRGIMAIVVRKEDGQRYQPRTILRVDQSLTNLFRGSPSGWVWGAGDGSDGD